MEAYLTENYIPIEIPDLSIPTSWNPQRPDPKTPYWKLLGYQQCMGNTMQNLLNWLGKVDAKLSSLAKMDTHSYYYQFELWMKQSGIQPGSNLIYFLGKHVEYANLLCKLANSEYSFEYFRNSKQEQVFQFDSIMDYHLATNRPAGLGTALTKVGHIMTSICELRTSNQDYLVVSDPFGHFPYRQTFGHNLLYSRELLANKLNSVVFIRRKGD